MFVLDSAAVTAFAAKPPLLAEWMRRRRDAGSWLTFVPSVVLVECLTGDPGRDARVNRLLKTCVVVDEVPVTMARAAARLRTQARRGSAIDALVVAMADPGGTVITGDLKDVRPLAAHAEDVAIERI